MSLVEITSWLAKVQGDEELQNLLGSHAFAFLLKTGDDKYLWTVDKKSVQVDDKLTLDHVWDFSIHIPQTAWEKFLAPVAPAFHNTLQAMVAKVQGVAIEGNRLIWAQSIGIVERILFLARAFEVPPVDGESDFAPESIKGHYIAMHADGEKYVTYYEEAGQGYPVIFLHTAGSDSRQYKQLLGNRELQKKWRMIAFDLPYHGKSEPPDGWWKKTYQLTTHLYTEWILGFMKALDLYDKKPIISGSSMGGAIVLYLAGQYGELFKGVISLEGGFGTAGRKISWTNHSQVHAGQFLASWVGGLMSPESPEYYRRLVLWEYAQGGPGVYQGDTHFYSHDFPEVSQTIGKTKCPLWILCGDYDYSCTPEMSEEAARRMEGTFVRMERMGHFPMSENPKGFLRYFLPVLEEASG
ncbi:alpha/beta fold hydrolase [Ferviditalea candida]|uniref:Alpha/beta hydrolase n=1 Tax=Ferviditalea candida TaxID=3108399 RepID=A0ABU5ZGA8_9BACL|nr:alpha/beta hydrolase [Paenibacillaceae bacterium T2]